MQVSLACGTLPPLLTLPFFVNVTIVLNSAVRTKAMTHRKVIRFAIPAGDYLKHMHHRPKRTSNALNSEHKSPIGPKRTSTNVH
jgi:hypothetical protein